MTLRQSLDTDFSPQSFASLPRPVLNVTLDCEEMSQQQGFGQGNWIMALYCVRIAAALAKVDYQFQCSSGRSSQLKLLLPWISGYHPAPTTDDPWPFDGEIPTENQACTDKYPLIRVDLTVHEIQKDIQSMAIELVGPLTDSLLSQNQQIQTKAKEYIPWISNVILDDVAIHFRCGDVFGGASRNDFGIIKYSEYPKWTQNDTRSIGILTQPFDKNLHCSKDAKLNIPRLAVKPCICW